MKKLPLEFKKYGYNYKQIDRGYHSAIYEQSSEGVIHGYEVIEIEVLEAGERFGKMYPERENYPSSERWGSLGFTVANLDHAKEKAVEIELKVLHRIEQKQLQEA